jgi:hypothetical protein
MWYGPSRRYEERQKAVVLRELQKAIIYTTMMSKQMTKSHVRDAVHMYPVNRGNIPPSVPENPVGRKTVSAAKHNKVKSD